MKRCDTIPDRWNTWSARRHAWHALFCRDCAATRRTDRALARGARRFRRSLQQTPVPVGLEGDIFARLGIQEPDPATISPSSRPDALERRNASLFPRWDLSNIGAVAAVAALALALASPGHEPPTKPVQRVTTDRPVPASPEQPMTTFSSTAPISPVGPPTWSSGNSSLSPRPRVSPSPRLRVPASSRHPNDDLNYLNEDPLRIVYRWAPMPADAWAKLEAEVRKNVRAKDDFVQIPLPRLVDASGTAMIVQAVEGYKREAAVVDARLFRKVTLAFKATALSDLCDRLKSTTGIAVTAGASVADEKVTIFCKEQPLRDVMRQLSRPFGYAWVRSGKQNEYRYELVQDLKSQLLEEELRERDRRAALISLDEELARYRPYLGLSPDEALVIARNATGEEKKRLERYASWAWGPIQIYGRLSPADLAALRAGRRINFSARPVEGERRLPADLERGVLQSVRSIRLVKTENSFRPAREDDPSMGIPPVQVPEARGRISIEIDQDDLGKMVYDVTSGVAGVYPGGRSTMVGGYLAVGESPSVRSPDNAVANRALARNADLTPRISVAPRPAYRPALETRTGDGAPSPTRGYTTPLPSQPMATTAEVLEAIHQATGMPLVADYYTRLYPASSLTARDSRLFDVLNRLSDTMRVRWHREGEWLQFRSMSYFYDRLQEVPNRLLLRWAASRKQHGMLTLEDLCEIVTLSRAQLDAESMAEGARALYGLLEWELFPRRGGLRPYLQHLATFTPAQRRQMQTPLGLSFSQMTLAQQQGLLALALGGDGDTPGHLEHLAGATMRVDYVTPGAYEWRLSEEARLRPGPADPFTAEALLPRVRERSQEAALLAARRLDTQVSAAQIFPSELTLTILYLPGSGSPLSAGGIHVARSTERRKMVIRSP